MQKQNRFRSWALWVGVAGAVWVILSAFGLPEKIGLTNDTWTALLNALGTILTLFGVVNNPTDKSAF